MHFPKPFDISQGFCLAFWKKKKSWISCNPCSNSSLLIKHFGRIMNGGLLPFTCYLQCGFTQVQPIGVSPLSQNMVLLDAKYDYAPSSIWYQSEYLALLSWPFWLCCEDDNIPSFLLCCCWTCQHKYIMLQISYISATIGH